MSIQWGSLLAVLVVSLSSTVAVVVLVSLAFLGLSARAAASDPTIRHPVFSPRAGTVAAVAYLAAAGAIVAFGLFEIVAR